MSGVTDVGIHPWMTEGACLDEDPELFFPIGEGGANAGQVQRATSICHRCEVEATCLRFALVNGVKEGIWGGRTETERQTLIRNRRRHRTRNHDLRGPRRRPGPR